MEEEKVQEEATESQTAEKEEEKEEEEVIEETSSEEEKEKLEQKPKVSGTVPTTRFNEVWGQMRRLERLASQLLEERKDFMQQKAPPKQEEEVNFDNMTPKQLVEYVESRAEKRAQEILEKTITPFQERTRAKEVSDSINQAIVKYPDFLSYKDDMIDLANAHPTLDAEEVYLLASGRKGEAGGKILSRLKDKVAQKKSALTEHRSSPASRQGKVQKFSTIREGALAAARELGFDVE